MATPDETKAALCMPGRLCYAPTQNGLLGAYPHGGTALGVVAAIWVEVSEEAAQVFQWEHGQYAPRKYVHVERWSFGFTVKDVSDPDLLGLNFRTTTVSAGGYTGAKTIEAQTSGKVDAISPLLFSPFDKGHKAVLIYAPVIWRPLVRMDFASELPTEYAGGVLAGRHDTVGKVVAVDLLEHLSLT